MRRVLLYAVYGNTAAAERARDELARSGFLRVALSRCLTEDGIAAEAPGQGYDNQPGERDEENDIAPYMDAVLSGAIVLTVEAETAAQTRSAEDIARRNGAYRLVLRRTRRFSLSSVVVVRA